MYVYTYVYVYIYMVRWNRRCNEKQDTLSRTQQ